MPQTAPAAGKAANPSKAGSSSSATAAAAFSSTPGSSAAAAAPPRWREPRGVESGEAPPLADGTGPRIWSCCCSGPSTATLYVRSTTTPIHTPSLPPPPPPPFPARSALPLSIGAETKATGSGGPGRYRRTLGATGPAPGHSPALRGPRIRRPRRAPRCQTSENLPKTHRMNFLVPRIQDGDVSTAEAAGSKTFTL
nr:SKI family transcriptional corepressor 1-like [Pongo pygmaeus]